MPLAAGTDRRDRSRKAPRACAEKRSRCYPQRYLHSSRFPQQLRLAAAYGPFGKAATECVGHFTQMLHQNLPVESFQIGVGNHFSDADMDVAADLVIDLPEEKRESQRHAYMACDLEQAAILPGKIDGHHGCLGRRDELS